MHMLIVAGSDLDRAGLIDRLLSALRPAPKLYGYRSVKEAAGPDGKAPIYIYPASGPRRQSEENLLGWCEARHAEARPEIFETHACLIEQAAPDGLLVLDEIGPMESRSPHFCAAVLKALDRDTPILAAVRDKDTPFLNAVRAHPKARCFLLTEENRERLFAQLCGELRKALGQ